MARYEVLAGKHGDANGRIYHKGDVVESDKDLTKAFKNKFRLVESPKVPSKPAVPVPVAVPTLEPAVEPEAAPSVVEAKTKEVNGQEEPVRKLGMDVTEDFPTAVDKGVGVYQKGVKFYVSRDGVEALNPKPLKPTEVARFIASIS